MSVKNEMHGNLPVFGMKHLFVHLEGYIDIIDCLDFYETSKLPRDAHYLLGLNFEVHRSVNMN